MKRVVQYSGGLCSFFAAKRDIDSRGKQDVVLLFADTKIEDEDLYRFLDETSIHLGLPVTRIADGRDPWDVFRDRRFLGNSAVDPCSLVLKRELLWSWMEKHAPQATVILGLDWTEEHRLERVRKYRPAWKIEAPMIEPPIVSKPQMVEELKKLGIKLPRLYELGFAHNNCGGFCVKSGHAQFRMLLKAMPDRYAYHEQKERELREFLGKDVSILKDRRHGRTSTLTLERFRKRIESGGYCDLFDWGGCGCAID